MLGLLACMVVAVEEICCSSLCLGHPGADGWPLFWILVEAARSRSSAPLDDARGFIALHSALDLSSWMEAHGGQEEV